MPELQLDKYTLHEELGRGGYGTVYRATDNVLEVPRAVKVLHPALAADPSFIERFRREAKFAARMKHPHIVPVYDLGEAEARFFLAMDYLPGGSVKDLLANEGRLSYERALDITRQIAAALETIHAQGLVHRDVKPGNILFDEKSNAALSDLGFAKAMSSAGSASLSVTGGMIGTPAYMAPEIWLGKEADPRSDTYSLACVFYEMLTGESLFGAGENSPPPLVMKRHFDPLELPETWPEGVPEGIAPVLERALAKEPKQRFDGARDFVEALESVKQPALSQTKKTAGAGGRPAADDRPQTAADEPPALRRGRLGRLLLAILGVGVLGLCGLFIYLLTSFPAADVVVETVVIEVTSTLAEIAVEPITTPTPLPGTPTPTLPASPTPLPPSATPDFGAAMVLIPVGSFQMGSEDGDSDEEPVHTVYLDAYWIDQTEVSYRQYQQFVEAENYTGDKGCGDGDDHPVACVDWYAARAYCAWRGARLPTEAEWEKAARGGLEGAKYPWGSDAPVCTPGAENGAQYGDCDGQRVAVKTFAPNGYGLYDMAGNVWEWVSSLYQSYPYDATDGREDLGASGGRVLRGGSWHLDGSGLRVAYRNIRDPSYTNYGSGFRCARSP